MRAERRRLSAWVDRHEGFAAVRAMLTWRRLKTEQWIMATPSRKPHLHDRRMDDARAEIARAMDRELRLRVSERAERVRQLSLEASVERSPDGLRRGS